MPKSRELIHAKIELEAAIMALRGYVQMMGSLKEQHYKNFEGHGMMPVLLEIVLDQFERSYKVVEAELARQEAKAA